MESTRRNIDVNKQVLHFPKRTSASLPPQLGTTSSSLALTILHNSLGRNWRSHLSQPKETMHKSRAIHSALGSRALASAPRSQFQVPRRFLQDVAITRTGKPILKVQGGR